MTWIELVGSIFGLVGVALTIRQNVWCWPIGLIQIFLFIWVFWETRLYSDFILHIIYAVLQCYGWWHWLSAGRAIGDLKVTSASRSALAGWAVLCLIATLIWGALMARFTSDVSPFPDTFITVTSLIAQWMLTRKTFETWYLWLIGDLVAIPLFTARGLYPIAGLHLILIALAITGIIQWKNAMRQDARALAERSPCEVPYT